MKTHISNKKFKYMMNIFFQFGNTPLGYVPIYPM